MRRPDRDSSPVLPAGQVVRRTFLWRFEKPEDAAAVARVLEMLEEWQYEMNQWGAEEDPRSTIAREVESAGADLMLLAEYLRGLAENREGSGLSVEDWRLCDHAAGWAEEAGRLGSLMVERASPPPAPES